MSIYKILFEAHSGLAYLVLLALIVATVVYFLHYMNKTNLRAKSKTVALLTMILVHLQFLLGIILYFVSPIIKNGLKDFGAAMGDPLTRLKVIEHPVIMLVVVVLVTLSHRIVKKHALLANQLTISAPVFFLLSLLLALSRIPWQTWLG